MIRRPAVTNLVKQTPKSLLSMTGFGRSELIEEGYRISVEMKAVNHRFCEVRVHAPNLSQKLKHHIEQWAITQCLRGRVDISIAVTALTASPHVFELDRPRLESYLRAVHELATVCQVEYVPNPQELAAVPHILRVVEVPATEKCLERLTHAATELAFCEFNLMRETEAQTLKTALLVGLNAAQELITQIQSYAPGVVIRHREKLTATLKTLGTDDSSRTAEFLQNLDRFDIDEELTRIDSHVKQFETALQCGGVVGRQLDFLSQELNRESNTIAAKAGCVEISKLAVELKTVIERIREQIQNLV